MDAIHALDILTEDGWREVFKKVWSPEDLKSCSETCTTFEGILERNKTTWMFDAILPQILKYLLIPGGASNRRRAWGIKNWNAVQTCRRVCKGWRQTVDHYLESHNGYFQGLFRPIVFEYWFQSRDGHRSGEFSDMFEGCTGNPFIGRFIYFDHTCLLDGPQGEPNQQDNHTLNLRQIFDRFGTEIWSVCVDNVGRGEAMSFCKNIRSLLGFLPNLKSLQLMPSFREDPGISQLPTFLAANPLPDNANLENLVIERPFKMTQSLLEKYGPQLKRLHLGHGSNGRAVTDNVHRFQVLKELEISSSAKTDSLTALRQLQSPLTSLRIHLQFGVNETSDEWPMGKLIRNILHLPLTDLWIITWNYFKGNVGAFPASLQHGSIRRVKITSYTTSSLSFNFLRCFPNLEEVNFEFPLGRIPKPSYECNLLIVKSEEEDMYESPVWDVIPSLRLISVETSPARWPKEYRRSTFEILRMEKTKEI